MLPPVAELLAGRRLLLTGATGFLGKVALARMLCEAPELARVTCLVRAEDEESARRRFVREVLRSPAFDPVRQRHGDDAVEGWLGSRLVPVAGHLERPGLGIGDAARAALRGAVDAVVSCAGLVDFEASLEEAYETNVLGPTHALDLARESGARHLLHVSTCYVPGRCDGHHGEDPIVPDWTPDGVGFDAEREVAEIRELLESIHREVRRQDAERACLEEARSALEREGRPATEANLAEAVEEARARWLRDRLRAEGLDRAERFGWPNTYTYTKSLGEQVLTRRRGALPVTVLRPAVIESALRFPFPGWNQGVNTSAPLIYLAKRGVRGFPFDPQLVLDVVPVDWVADALLVTVAAALQDPKAAPPVVQVGTGARNPLSMGRIVELTALGLRRREDEAGGPRGVARILGGRLDPVTVSQLRYRTAALPALGRLAGALGPALDALGDGGRASRPTSRLGRAARAAAATARALSRQGALVDRLVEVYRPYSNELHYVFHCERLIELRDRLDPADRERLGYAPESLDWAHYWMDVHLPGLERWSLPELEARQRRERRAPRSLADWLERMCQRDPDRPLVVTRDDRRTRAEILAAAGEEAAKLEARGIAPGTRVALELDDPAGFPVRLLAIAFAGAVPVLDPEAASGPAPAGEDEPPALVVAGRGVALGDLRAWVERSRSIAPAGGDRILCALDPEDPDDRVTILVQGWLAAWTTGAAVVAETGPEALSVATIRSTRPSVALAPAWAWGALHRELRACDEAEDGGLVAGLRRAALGSLAAQIPRGAGAAPVLALREWLAPAAAVRLGDLRRGFAVGEGTPNGLRGALGAFGVELAEGLAVAGAGGLVAVDRRARGELTALGEVRLLVSAGEPEGSDRAGRLAISTPETAVVLETDWLAEPLRRDGEGDPDAVRLLGRARDRFLRADGSAVDPARAERRLGFLPGLSLEVGCASVDEPEGTGLGALVVPDPAASGDPSQVEADLRAALASRARRGPAAERPDRVVVTTTPLARGPSGALDREALRARLRAPDSARLVPTTRVRRLAREAEAFPVPRDLARPLRTVLQGGVERIVRHGFTVSVHGRGHVPVDRPVIVVSNHASHVDAPLLRHAMGPAGRRLSAMGARDYFFGSLLARTVYEQMTDVEPFDRSLPSAQAMEGAVALLRRGRSVLFFPEGTRSDTGLMQRFRSGVAVLALQSGADVLPAHVSGTSDALPKGRVLPRPGTLRVRFGPVLPAAELAALVTAAEDGEAAERAGIEAVRARIEAAVHALHEAERASAGRDPERLRRAVEQLRERFLPEEWVAPRTWYFSLDAAEWGKWTVRAERAGAEVWAGRPAEPADCVLVAPPEVFLRMLEEGEIPPVADFVAGRLKTNRPDLLREFQRLFGI
jgi:1-acyl-sn-glycerol-3-phosphate acyltransferase